MAIHFYEYDNVILNLISERTFYHILKKMYGFFFVCVRMCSVKENFVETFYCTPHRGKAFFPGMNTEMYI